MQYDKNLVLSAIEPETIVAAVAQKTRLKTKVEAAVKPSAGLSINDVNLANKSGETVAVLGTFNDSCEVNIRTKDGIYELLCLENDRFGVGGTAWFDLLSSKISYLGKKR